MTTMTNLEGLYCLADLRSWALHCEVAKQLADRPEILTRARARVEAWCRDPGLHPYAMAWKTLLEAPVPELQDALRSKDETMCTLRQASPFAGALDSKTRWKILKQPHVSRHETR